MRDSQFSIRRAYVLTGILLLIVSASMLAVLFRQTGDMAVIGWGLLFIFLVLFCVAVFIGLVRQKLTRFSQEICGTLDHMINGGQELPPFAEEDGLFSKINHRLGRLYEVLGESRRRIAKERGDLQELISDISHQVKTPMANLKMINATLLGPSVSEEKQKEFLQAAEGQLDKLDFLMLAMIKTSRLEAGVIALEKKVQPIYGTLAAALGGILLNAEKKRIGVAVTCEEELTAFHDPRWTGEALFNIMDNAVKYTPEGGSIAVCVTDLELYLKIEIADSGRGISEVHQGAVFKRFYREEAAGDVEGIGIGLYLAREIITMQGGYIKLNSSLGQGSVFSVFLPHHWENCKCHEIDMV